MHHSRSKFVRADSHRKIRVASVDPSQKVDVRPRATRDSSRPLPTFASGSPCWPWKMTRPQELIKDVPAEPFAIWFCAARRANGSAWIVRGSGFIASRELRGPLTKATSEIQGRPQPQLSTRRHDPPARVVVTCSGVWYATRCSESAEAFWAVSFRELCRGPLTRPLLRFKIP